MGKLRSFLCLMWIFTACQVPTAPNDEAEPAKRLTETQTFTIQLWAGRIKYAAYVGGAEWRTTFEAKVIADSSVNIREKCEITFFWKAQHSRPAADEGGWISAGSAGQAYPHGLMSIDGHWVDRVPQTTPPFWMRVIVTCESFESAVNVIGKCNFLESVEEPDRVWVSSVDLDYDLCDRVLATFEIKNNTARY